MPIVVKNNKNWPFSLIYLIKPFNYFRLIAMSQFGINNNKLLFFKPISSRFV